MPRGGARPGAGRKKGSTAKVAMETRPTAINEAAKAAGITPLEFMLSVMNDEAKPLDVRLRMAQAAAPFVHPKPSEGGAKGKREQEKEAAEQAASGKFAVPAPPRLVVNNR